MSTETDFLFCQLTASGLISFSGDDAVAFLHAQLTSDVAALGSSRTQYSGYCSPKGRLLATALLWPRSSGLVMMLPVSLRESIQARLAKYVLRARVKVADASAELALFGLTGKRAPTAVASFCQGRIPALHEIVTAGEHEVTSLPIDRYLLLARAQDAPRVRDTLLEIGSECPESTWWALDIEAGIPVITPDTQEAYVPQMVNLDLVGGVSYTKGCYPGQEIVARTHYLGKLKQRMYRVRVSAESVVPGDPLYSHAFGPDQASGAILHANGSEGDSREALAVLQKSAVAPGSLHFRSPDGPEVEVLSLPYPLPD